MTNIKETPPAVNNPEELKEGLELQAEILVAAYAELFKRRRSFFSFGIKTKKLRKLSELFRNKYWQKSNVEEANILSTDPRFKDLPYFQLQAHLLEHPLSEDTRAGDFFVLCRKANGYFHFRTLHHLEQKSFEEKEEEVLNGLSMAVQVRPEFFSRDCFPVQIDYIDFVEIEPGKATENFKRIFGQNQQNPNLRVLCACLAAYDIRPVKTFKKVDEFYFQDKIAFCFIQPNPQEKDPCYVLQPPLVVFDKITHFEKLYGDLKNLSF